MFARLERYVFAALVALALWAAVSVAVPAVAQAQAAQAQEKATSNKADTLAAAERPVVVVDPGDTLWSISAEVLRPNAAPWRVARGVERIYALNRSQIGPDPNLLVAGQQLVLPDRLVRPATAERPARSATGATPKATPTRNSAEAAEAGPKGQLAKNTTHEAPRKPAVGPLDSDDSAPSPVDSFLRTVRSAADVGATAVAGFFAEFRADGRRMLGLGIMLGTLVVAALLAWKLPTRRTLRGDAERWGIPTGYYGSEPTRHVAPFAYHPGSLGEGDRQRAERAQREEWRREVRANGRAYQRAYGHASFDPSPDEELVNGTTGAHANGNVPVGMILAAERKRGRLRRRGRQRSPARRVRRGLAHGAYSPSIRHLLRGSSVNHSGAPLRRPAARGSITAAPRRTGVGTP